jgi:hypothetical protein
MELFDNYMEFYNKNFIEIKANFSPAKRNQKE